MGYGHAFRDKELQMKSGQLFCRFSFWLRRLHFSGEQQWQSQTAAWVVLSHSIRLADHYSVFHGLVLSNGISILTCQGALLKQGKSVSGPTTASAVSQKIGIKVRAFRPQLVDCCWLIKPGRYVLKMRDGFHAAFYPSLMKGRQSLLPPLIQKGLKQSCLWNWKDQSCLFLYLMCCWESYRSLCCEVCGWFTLLWVQEVSTVK